MASPAREEVMDMEEPAPDLPPPSDNQKYDEQIEAQDESSKQASAANAAIHLMLGSAFGMKVPPPEYSGIPQLTPPETSPENPEVKHEEGQGDSMFESTIEQEPALPLEPKPTKSKSKRKKNRAQAEKDDLTIMPLISAPPSIVANPPSRITGPIELDEDDFNKNDREKSMGRYSSGRNNRGRRDDRGHSEDRGMGEGMDDDDHSPGRGPWRRPRHGKYKYPDDFDEEDFEEDYGERDHGRDYDDYGPPHERGRPGPPGRDFGPGPRPFGQRPNFHGPPHGHPGPPGPPGFGPRNFGPDGPYGADGHGNFGPHGYGPGPMMGPRGPPPMGPGGPPMGPNGPPMGPGGPPMGPNGPPMGPGGPPMGQGGPPMGPGGPPMGPGNFPPHGYGPGPGMGPGPPQGPGFQGPPGPPGPGFPPLQGPWQGEGFPPPPQTNFNMPNMPQPPQTFSGEVFHGQAFQSIPPAQPAPPKPQVAQESAEKLIAMGMNPDLAKILDADNKNKPRTDSSGGTPKKKSKKKKKRGDSDKVFDEQSYEYEEVPLPMSIPLPDDVPLPPEPKKKKKKKRDKDLENVMFPPLPDAVPLVGPAPKPATPPIPVLQPEQPMSAAALGSADMPQLPPEASAFPSQTSQSFLSQQSHMPGPEKISDDQPPLLIPSTLMPTQTPQPGMIQNFQQGLSVGEAATALPFLTQQQGILGNSEAPTTLVSGHQTQMQQVSQSQVIPIAQSTLNQQVLQGVPAPQISLQGVSQPVRRSRFDPNWTPEHLPSPAVVSVTPPIQTAQVPIVSQQAQVSTIQQQIAPQHGEDSTVIHQQVLPVSNNLQTTPEQQVEQMMDTVLLETMKSDIAATDIEVIDVENKNLLTKHDNRTDEILAMETDETVDETEFSEEQLSSGEGYIYYDNKASGKEENAAESQIPKEPVTASQLLEKFKQKRQLKKADSKSELTKFPVGLPTPLSQQTSMKEDGKGQDKGQGKFTFAIRKLKQLEAEKEEEEKQVLTALSTEGEQKYELYKEMVKETSAEKREKYSKEKDLEGKSKSLFKERRKKSKSLSPDRRSLSRSGSRERKKHKKQKSISRERSRSRERKKSRDRSRSKGRRSRSKERSRSRDRSKRRERSLSPWRKDREFFKRYGRFPRPGEADGITHESNTSRERGRYGERSNERTRTSRVQGSRRSRERSVERSRDRRSRERESRDRRSREKESRDRRSRERESRDRRSRDKDEISRETKDKRSRERSSAERSFGKRDKRGGVGKERKYSRDSEEREHKQSKDRKNKEKDKKKKKHKQRKDESSSRSDSSGSDSDSEEEKIKSKKKKERKSRSLSEDFLTRGKERDLSVDEIKSKSKDENCNSDIENEPVVVKTEPPEEMETDVQDNVSIEIAEKKGGGLYDGELSRTTLNKSDDDRNVAMETSNDLPEAKTSEKQLDRHSSSSEDERDISRSIREKRSLTSEEKDKFRRQEYSKEKEIARQYEKDKLRDKERRQERYNDGSGERLKSYKDDRQPVRDDLSDYSRKERSRQRGEDEEWSRDKRERYEREERYRETKEEKYKKVFEEDKDKRGKRYDRKGDNSDSEDERGGRKRYKDYISDGGDNYKSSRKDDSRHKRHDDRLGRADQVEHTIAKSKWESGSESGDDYEKTHNEELLPARSSSGNRARKEDASSSKNVSGMVKLEIDISKINQLKLFNKMMKAKQQRDSVSDQSSDSSDDDSKSKRKQKKDKASKKKNKKDRRRHADSESDNEDSPIKQKKKKKTKKKKKNDDDDEEDDSNDEGSSKKKERRKQKHRHGSSNSDSSEDETKSRKKLKEGRKLKKYDSESDESVTRSKKSKDKSRKEKESRYESPDEYEYKKKGGDKRTKKSKYQSDSEEEKSERRIKEKQKGHRDTEKKNKDRYTKQELMQLSGDDTRYQKDKEKQKRHLSRDSNSMDDEKDYSRQRNRSLEKHRKESKEERYSRRDRRHSEESELSNDDTQRKKRNKKSKTVEKYGSESDDESRRKKGKNRSDSEEDYRGKKGKIKESRKYDDDDSDDKFTEIRKGIKRYKEHYMDKDSEGKQKKQSTSKEKDIKSYKDRRRQISRSDSESDTNARHSVSLSKERKMLPKDKIIDEEKRSLSKEKRNVDNYDTGKVRKRSRSNGSRSKSRSRSRSKVLKSEKQRKRYPSESDSGKDTRHDQSRTRDDSSDGERRWKKYEDTSRSRDKDIKRSERVSMSPRSDDKFEMMKHSPKRQEKEMKERKKKDRGESYDEDYRSRKKREVDKYKRRDSSSKSDDTSSSSSDSESDMERKKRHSKHTVQKNVKAGTGFKMGPVPGTPQIIENTDTEKAENNFKEKVQIDEVQSLSDSNINDSASKSSPEKPTHQSEVSENEDPYEKSSIKELKKKDKKEKKKHKKKKKKKKKKQSGLDTDKTEKLNSSTDSFQSVNTEHEKSDNVSKDEEIVSEKKQDINLNKLQKSSKLGLDQTKHLLVDYESDSSSLDELKKSKIKDDKSNLLEKIEENKEEPMETDQLTELKESNVQCQKGKARISFRLSCDSDTSTNRSTSTEEVKDTIEMKNVSNEMAIEKENENTRRESVKEDLYDPFESLNNSSESDSELQKSKVDLTKNIVISKSEKPSPVTSNSSILPSVNILPDIGIGSSLSKITVQPIVYPFQALHSVIAPVPAPVGVPAPSNQQFQQSTVKNISNPPAVITQKVLPLPPSLDIPPPTVTIPSLGVSQRSVEVDNSEKSKFSTINKGDVKYSVSDTKTVSKSKQVHIKTFVPHEKGHLKGKTKSRWDSDDQMNAEQGKNRYSEDLYDPFSVDSDPSPMASPKDDKHRETGKNKETLPAVKGKDEDFDRKIVEDSIQIPDETGASANQQEVSSVAKVAPLKGPEKTDTQKITMKFTTGRKVIGKSAIMVEDVEESDELSCVPKLKLSTHTEDISTAKNVSAKSFFDTKMALKKSMQAAEFIERQLEKCDPEIEMKDSKEEQIKTKSIIGPHDSEEELKPLSKSNDKSRSLSKDRRRSVSKDRKMSKTRGGNRGDYKRSLSKEKKRSSSRERKGRHQQNKSISIGNQRSPSYERMRSSSIEKTRDLRRSHSRERQRGKRSSRDRSLSRENKYRNKTKERRARRSSSHERRRRRSYSREKKKAKSKSPEEKYNRHGRSLEHSSYDRHERTRRNMRGKKSISRSPSSDRDKNQRMRKQQRKRRSSDNETSETSSSSSSDDEENDSFEKVEPMKIDSVDGSVTENISDERNNEQLSPQVSETSKEIAKLPPYQEGNKDFIGVDDEISFKVLTSASTFEKKIDSSDEVNKSLSSPSTKQERSNLFEKFSPEKKSIKAVDDFKGDDQEKCDELKGSWGRTPTGLFKYSPKKIVEEDGKPFPMENLLDMSPTKLSSESRSFVNEKEQLLRDDSSKLLKDDEAKIEMTGTDTMTNKEDSKPIDKEMKRLTRKQASAQNISLPPVMSKDMQGRARKVRKVSSDVSPTVDEIKENISSSVGLIKQTNLNVGQIVDDSESDVRHEGKQESIQDVLPKYVHTGEETFKKSQTTEISTRLEHSINVSEHENQPEVIRGRIEDIPMPTSSIDENENTVGSKATKAGDKSEESNKEKTEAVDMDLDEPEETPQNIEIVQIHPDKDLKQKLNSLDMKERELPEQVRQEEAKRLLQETFVKDSMKGFSIKLQPNVLKKPKKKLNSQMLEDVFDTESSLSVKPKLSFKLSDDPIKPLSFGPPEFHILPKPPVLTTAVASFKPLSEETNTSSTIRQPENAIEVIGPTNMSAVSSETDSKQEDKMLEEISAEENPEQSLLDATNVQVVSESTVETSKTPHAEDVIKAETILKTSQISPEQIGKAIQVIGQENLRRLEVLQRESAKLLQGKKIEVVGQRLDNTKVTPSTHLSETSFVHSISDENPNFERKYDDADLGQLQQEKLELLKKLNTQNIKPALEPSNSITEGQVFHGQVAYSQSSDSRETENSAANAQRDYDRNEERRYRNDGDYDRRSTKGRRDRRKSRDSRSRERSRDRDNYRGRDRGRSRDRSWERDRKKKKRFREEERHRSRRRSRSWSRDRRSRSRDRRSRSRDRRSRSRDRRSRSRGREKRSRSRDRRSRSRDRRSRSKDRRKSRRSRSRSRNRRSRSRSRERDKKIDKMKSEKPRKESALEKFEKELAEKKKVLLQPVASSPVVSSVSHSVASPALQHLSAPDTSNQFIDNHGQFVQADPSSAPHFLPQPFPVHQTNMPMFPMGQSPMPDQQYTGFPGNPNIFPHPLMGPQQQPPIGPQFYPESMPPHMIQGPMPPGPQQPFPMGPGFGPPGMFPPGLPQPMDPNMMPIHQPMPLEHGHSHIGPNTQLEIDSGPPVGPLSGPHEDEMHQNSFEPQSSRYHQSSRRSRPSFESARHFDVKTSEPEEEGDRTPIPDFNEEDEDQLEFKHGFGGPGIPGHPNLKQLSKSEPNENEIKESKRKKKRVSRFEPIQDDPVIDEQDQVAQPELQKSEGSETFEEIKTADKEPIVEKSPAIEDTTGFGKWQPVSPVKRANIGTFEDGSEQTEKQFSKSIGDKSELSSRLDEGVYDEGTPQSQSEDMSDSDVGVGKPIKVKSRWRRASEAETPPPPPPPSKKFEKEAETTEPEEKQDEEIPIDFELIDENIFLAERKRSKQMREVRRMVCDCTTCKEDREMGYDACGEDCLNRMLFIECGSKCPCGEHCTNKRFQKKQNAKVSPFRTDWKGCGLKALEDLEPGEFVMEYVGEVLDYQLFKKRSKQYSKAGQQHFYFMAINPEEIVDATVKGNISRFINHSCDPNCETQKWTVNGTLRVGFFVRKPIKEGEEITFDYKYEVYGKEAQKCYCGTDICRGWLGGDKRMELRTTRRSTSVDEVEKKKKELFDDSDKLEEEIERMSELHQGLRNKDDVLNMCRLMVRAEDPEHRLQILRVLENTEQQGCLRLFLDYHGLPLVWCWMADAKLQVSDLKHIMLKVLKKLPITNKTILEDSKILDIVKKWSEPGDTLDVCEGSDILETSQEITDTDNTENDEESLNTPPITSNKNPVSILASIRDKKAVKKSVKFAEVESSSDSESRASASESDLPGDSVEGDVTSSSQALTSSVKTRRQLRELRRRVLEKDAPDIKPESVSQVTQSTDADSSSENQSALSPKEENVEESDKRLAESEENPIEMSENKTPELSEDKTIELSEDKTLELCEDKTLELSEETQPEDKTGAGISEKESEELELIVRAAEIKNLASDLLEHWSTLKEIYKIPKKQVLEERKKTEREIDSNYEKIALIEDRKKKVSGWDTVKGRKRKRETSYKEDTDDSDSNNASRKTLLQTPPKMSKSERRQLFEAQVKAQDELAAEYQRHQEQMQLEQYEQEQMIQQQHQRQLMQDPGFWYYATQDPNFLPSIGIDPQQFLQQLAMDPVLLQQLMATIPNFQQQLEHLTFMYQQAVLQASQLEMTVQPEPMPIVDDNEPMTEQHMAFLQQVEAFKQQHLEPSKTAALSIEEEDVPPPPSPPKGKAIVLPPNWKTAKDAEGKLYYYHTVTRQTQWDPPNLDTGEHTDDMDLGTPTQDDTVSRYFVASKFAFMERERVDSNPVMGGDQKEEKEKTTTAAADTSSETNRKLKEQFKTKMSSWIVLCLNPFRKPDCKLGRVSSTEDFKHLARKLTHHVMAKELKHCRHVEDLEVNENVKSKAKDFVKKYMTKFGASYKRSGNSPTYE